MSAKLAFTDIGAAFYNSCSRILSSRHRCSASILISCSSALVALSFSHSWSTHFLRPEVLRQSFFPLAISSWSSMTEVWQTLLDTLTLDLLLRSRLASKAVCSRNRVILETSSLRRGKLIRSHFSSQNESSQWIAGPGSKASLSHVRVEKILQNKQTSAI